MAGHVEFEFAFAKGTPGTSRRGERFRILVIGDFRGAARGDGDAARFVPVAVDVDNVDARMAALAPAADVLDAAGAAHRLSFASLDDFHPDALLGQVATWSAVASAPAAEESPAKAKQAAPEADTPESDADTFSRLLGQSADEKPRSPAGGMLDRFIQQVVADDALPSDELEAAHESGAASAHAEHMRAVLHHPSLQQLEASWRGLHAFVDELDIGESLTVHFLDLGAAALHAALDVDDYQESPLFRALVTDDHGRFGGQAWHLVCSDFDFDARDVRRLGNLGAIAAAAGGVLLAGDGGVSAADDREAAGLSYADLRALPVARHIGLVAPRVLLRLPYGRRSDPVDAFDFEECVGRPDRDALLWGSSAPLLALELGRLFLAAGWRMSPGGQVAISDRPAYAFSEDGERHLADVASEALSDSEAEAVLDRGVMPMVAERNGNRLIVPRVQSIAAPAALLAGAWR